MATAAAGSYLEVVGDEARQLAAGHRRRLRRDQGSHGRRRKGEERR
jgi:hypothetical protein